MSIAENVRAFWVSKLGTARLAELSEGAGGRSTLEKARTILRSNKGKEFFYALVSEGFDGYFHQSAFLRTVDHKVIKKKLAAIETGHTEHGIEWWARDDNPNHIRILAAVVQRMEFLTENNQAVPHNILVPAMVELVGDTLRVRALTVQSTASTWTQLIEVPIRRLLTSVADTEIADRLIVSTTDLEHLGTMQNLSAQAIALMKNTEHVYTYSGTLSVEKVGRTSHMTEGARIGGRRQPMHKVMRSRFNELVSADQIRHCDIEIYEKFQGLPAGTALVMYPIEGKIVFRRMLSGGVINDFLAYLAR
jgi:hypothetical protein